MHHHLQRALAATLIIFILTPLAHAGQLNLTVHTWAKHPFSSRHYNSRTFGLGLRYDFDSRWSLAGGQYENSDYGHTRYLVGEYRFLPPTGSGTLTGAVFFGSAWGYPISPMPVVGLDVGLPIGREMEVHMLLTPPSPVSASAVQLAFTFKLP